MDRRNKRGLHKKRGSYGKKDPMVKREPRPDDDGGPCYPNGRPKNLRGREIGLWYARKNKLKDRQKPEGHISCGTVQLTESTRTYYRQFLDRHVPTSFRVDGSSYDHVENSTFKREFLDIIGGDISEKLVPTGGVVPNPSVDELLLKQWAEMLTNPRYVQMLSKRKRLPAYKMKDRIMETIETNQVTIVCGETGCGKTTQIAQFVLDEYMATGRGSMCRIVCSQPRRISAISVAERVAEERGEKLGTSVGFHIRLENKLPRKRGSIVFCTTGVILQQLQSDVSMSEISHLILDEIHERDVMSDFLITLMRRVIQTRRDLKLVLMSATLNAEKFAAYFGVDSILEIPGFTFPVEEFYLEDVLLQTGYRFPGSKLKGSERSSDSSEFNEFIVPHVRNLRGRYPARVCGELMKPASEGIDLELVLELILYICRQEPEDGAILVFLTGMAHISTLNKLLRQSGHFPPHRFLIIPLHSQMPSVEQREIFEPPPRGVRKIIISTNIAETSITIDDVVYVIDGGRIKIGQYDVDLDQETLKPEWVALANADQRRGRAGRVRAGKCWHLFSLARKMLLETHQKPEILRMRLETVVLKLKILQLGKAEEFLNSVMDPPDPRAVTRAIELLTRLNALDDQERLTPLGYHLARLPVGPQMGKMLLMGSIFSCLDPILSIAASLDFKEPFQMPLGREREVDRKKVELADGHKSDHLLLHLALKGFEGAYNKRAFCWEYFLSHSTMTQLVGMKTQFMQYLLEQNFVASLDPKSPGCNVNSGNFCLIKAIVCSALYPNVLYNQCRISSRKMTKKVCTLDRSRVSFHPKSVLSSCSNYESPLFVYFRRMRSLTDYIHDATMVYPLSLLFFGDRFQEIDEDGGEHYVTIADVLKFRCHRETARIISELRQRLNWFFEQKVSHPGHVDWSNKDEVGTLRIIMDLITNEDCGLLEIEDFDDDDFDISIKSD